MLSFTEYIEKHYNKFPTNPLANPRKDKKKKDLLRQNNNTETAVAIDPEIGSENDGGRFIEFDA